jgi:hypothetical protein
MGKEWRTLVRLAFKSFELDIPFSSKDISGKENDPHSELLYKSHHVDKIEKMKQSVEGLTIP